MAFNDFRARNTRRGCLHPAAALFLASFFTMANGAAAGYAEYQAEPVSVFGDRDALVPGAASLTRTPGGISYAMNTSELPPGVNTIWIVIFNRPENCAAGPGDCAPSDLSDPDVEASVVAGAGYIAGEDGIASFVGALGKGAPPAGIQKNVPGGTVDGLKHPFKAEIHLVVRTHGPIHDPEDAVAQLTTFETASACAAAGRVCRNVQMAIFEGVD